MKFRSFASSHYKVLDIGGPSLPAIPDIEMDECVIVVSTQIILHFLCWEYFYLSYRLDGFWFAGMQASAILVHSVFVLILCPCRTNNVKSTFFQKITTFSVLGFRVKGLGIVFKVFFPLVLGFWNKWSFLGKSGIVVEKYCAVRLSREWHDANHAISELDKCILSSSRARYQVTLLASVVCIRCYGVFMVQPVPEQSLLCCR